MEAAGEFRKREGGEVYGEGGKGELTREPAPNSPAGAMLSLAEISLILQQILELDYCNHIFLGNFRIPTSPKLQTLCTYL